MAKPEFMWRDVSNVSGIETRATQDLELHQALTDLGFRSVGYVERRMPILSDERVVKYGKSTFIEPDFIVYRDLGKQGEVYEVLASPDARALAAVTMDFGGPVVTFRSISEMGRVVDTDSKSVSGPRYRRSLAAQFRRLVAQPPRPLETRAESGYFGKHEQISVVDLWELHKKRVQSILEANGEVLRSHDSVAIFVAGSYQLHRILASIEDSSKRFIRLLTTVLWGVLILLVLCLCVAGIALYGKGWLSVLVTISMTGLGLLGLLSIAIFASQVFYHRVQPRLSGPKPMMLDELLKEIEGLSSVSAGDQAAG